MIHFFTEKTVLMSMPVVYSVAECSAMDRRYFRFSSKNLANLSQGMKLPLPPS